MPSVSHPLPSPLHFLLYIAPSDSSPCAPFPLSHFHTVSLLLNSAPPFTSPHFTPFTPHSCLFTSPSYTLVSYSPFFHCLALIFLTFPPAALPFLPISPHLCFALPYIWAAVLPSSHSLSLSLFNDPFSSTSMLLLFSALLDQTLLLALCFVSSSHFTYLQSLYRWLSCF